MRFQQRALAPPEEPSAEDDGAVILPTVSSAWSNVTARTTARAYIPQTNFTATDAGEATNGIADAEANLDAVGARAKDLLARAALNGIGLDPDAEQFWLAAINDPAVAAEERQELITSLEQAGFNRRVTSEDLPLIASRIALIEEVAPNAMDSVNAAAFQDTYRNLMAMFANLIATERAPEQPELEGTVTGTGE